MKDATYVQLAGYLLAGWLCTVMLYVDGEAAMYAAIAVAGAGAGLGQYIAQRQAIKNGAA